MEELNAGIMRLVGSLPDNTEMLSGELAICTWNIPNAKTKAVRVFYRDEAGDNTWYQVQGQSSVLNAMAYYEFVLAGKDYNDYVHLTNVDLEDVMRALTEKAANDLVRRATRMGLKG